ncbi:zinc finger protein 771-like [Micropterus dolomieu]|uniref:zinc finger protein 771-like n=1 Tax=Micropterus dolomieu TaxID=147949 RepID=UPI001E8D02FD|nr:zinc finger protein 771-like [Micropterus dolomieu]
MSKVQMLRGFINQRLTAAAEEIFGLFERTISEYEEELCRSKEENQRHRKLLDAVFQPEVRLHRAGVQQLLVSKEEVPPEQQQQWSPRLDQEDPPEPPHIKEEQEELWTSQEGEQLPGLEEADITKFPFTPVPVKSEEDDEEKPESSQLHQSQTEENRDAEHLETEADGEDCGGPEPAWNFNPDSPLQPTTHGQTSLPSEPETDDSCDWEETREPVQRGEKPFGCSVCGQRFKRKGHLRRHLNVHTGEKPFSCSVCPKRFALQGTLRRHLTVHTGEKIYSCSVCSKTFSLHETLRRHLTVHTGEKPFSCSVCGKKFTQKGNLRQHLKVHTGEKPFSCSVCGKRFTLHATLRQHLPVHTGEKPFSCSVCDKRFTRLHIVKTHKCVGESSGNK